MSTALGCTNAVGSTTGVTPLMDQTRTLIVVPLRCSLHPSHTLALRNIRIHGESSPQSPGCQDICTVRNTRSGCGIRIVKRPSAVVQPLMAPREAVRVLG